MKKYTYQAAKHLHEKPGQTKYIFTPPARVTVVAENEAEAEKLAERSLEKKFFGTGILLDKAVLVDCAELPVDWSYGYCGERSSGATDTIPDRVGGSKIR